MKAMGPEHDDDDDDAALPPANLLCKKNSITLIYLIDGAHRI